MSVANRPVHRPLSPHLQIYKPQLTSVLSILHRATGIALSVGALYLALWVICAAAGPATYAPFQSFNTSILGRIFLGGWLFSRLLSPVQRHPAPVLGCGLRLRAQGRLSQRLDRRRRRADRHGGVVDRRPQAGVRRGR